MDELDMTCKSLSVERLVSVKCHMTGAGDADSIMRGSLNTHTSTTLAHLWFCAVTSSNHDGPCLLQACLVFDS